MCKFVQLVALLSLKAVVHWNLLCNIVQNWWKISLCIFSLASDFHWRLLPSLAVLLVPLDERWISYLRGVLFLIGVSWEVVYCTNYCLGKLSYWRLSRCTMYTPDLEWMRKLFHWQNLFMCSTEQRTPMSTQANNFYWCFSRWTQLFRVHVKLLHWTNKALKWEYKPTILTNQPFWKCTQCNRTGPEFFPLRTFCHCDVFVVTLSVEPHDTRLGVSSF